MRRIIGLTMLIIAVLGICVSVVGWGYSYVVSNSKISDTPAKTTTVETQRDHQTTQTTQVNNIQVTRKEVEAVLTVYFPKRYTICNDGTYFTCSLEEWKKFLQEDNLNSHAYIADKFDCEDFAIGLRARATERGISLGMLIVSSDDVEGHMLNFFIVKETGGLAVYFLDPQTDEVSRPTASDQAAVIWLMI